MLVSGTEGVTRPASTPNSINVSTTVFQQTWHPDIFGPAQPWQSEKIIPPD